MSLNLNTSIEANAEASGVTEVTQGTVYKKSQGHYGVRVDGHLIDCEISSRLRKRLEYPIAPPTSRRRRVIDVHEIRVVDPVAIGDVVQFVPAGNGRGVITAVLPRRNQIARQDPGPRPIQQVIAANIDYMVHVVAAAHPEPKWELLDRYLASTEKAEIPSLVVLTKADLLDDPRVEKEAANFRKIGYPVILTSSATGQGIEELRGMLRDNLSVFVGMSGVGKSTLLNALQPELALRVNQISASTGKGKHTTTHLEMFDFDFGGRVVDTPGLKYLTLWEMAGTEVADYFIEMAPYLGKCKFGADCSHDHEPDCAVKRAVKEGAISERRYARLSENQWLNRSCFNFRRAVDAQDAGAALCRPRGMGGITPPLQINERSHSNVSNHIYRNSKFQFNC